MIAETVYRLAKSGRRVTSIQRWIRALVYTPPGAALAVLLISRLDRIRRRAAILLLMPTLKPWPRRRLLAAARSLSARASRVEIAEVYWLAVARSTFPKAMSALFSEEAERVFTAHPGNLNLLLARAWAAYETGRYRLALKYFDEVRQREPEALTLAGGGLAAAYSASQLRSHQQSITYLSQQFEFVDPFGHHSDEELEEVFKARVLERTMRPLLTCLVAPLLATQSAQQAGKRYGIFYLSSTDALGHAILDPYHFLALRRSDYDRIFFIGPPKSAYRPASATCLQIVEQYGDYVEVDDHALLNLSWMSAGTIRFGQVDLVIEHYWSLLREAVHRTLSTNDPFIHNQWHMTLPGRLIRRGEHLCERMGIDLDSPIVILHARHSSYHGLAKQSYRDAPIEDYVPAIKHLLAQGFQVVRIGDKRMPKLDLAHRKLFQIPYHRDYDTGLDPFLISRARFMVGCQSGPCAYARALGIPVLSVNAVLHYTLLPSPMEMACFKRYRRLSHPRQSPSRGTPMSLTQALEEDAQHLENSQQFLDARTGLSSVTPKEILAAVSDMVRWVENPEAPLTEEQSRFRTIVDQKMVELAGRGESLDLPIADYLGIALPGYRLSPSVARMRREVDVSPPAPARISPALLDS